MKTIVLILCSILIFMSAPLIVQAADVTEDLIKIGSTGDDVFIIQERLKELGYLNFRATGKYSNITFEAVRRFQQNNSIPDDGQIGASTLDTLFSDEAVGASKNPDFKIVYGPHLNNPSTFGELTDWAEVSNLFPVGANVTIQDLYNTGNSFQMQRTGGINNARVETVSQADTDSFTDMFGGSTWEKRPVLATINGVTYAASLFGAPNGENSISGNGMNGGTQLFFYKSLSDLFSLRDEEHANSVLKAAGEIF